MSAPIINQHSNGLIPSGGGEAAATVIVRGVGDDLGLRAREKVRIKKNKIQKSALLPLPLFFNAV